MILVVSHKHNLNALGRYNDDSAAFFPKVVTADSLHFPLTTFCLLLKSNL